MSTVSLCVYVFMSLLLCCCCFFYNSTTNTTIYILLKDLRHCILHCRDVVSLSSFSAKISDSISSQGISTQYVDALHRKT